MSQNVREIYIFDFDETLVHGDTLWSFLAALRGRVVAGLALLLAFWQALFSHKQYADLKTAIKAHWLHLLVAGMPADRAEEAASRIKFKWKEPAHSVLMAAHNKGAHILLATGALDVALIAALRVLPHHGLLCTPLQKAVAADGTVILTGAMAGANCVRAAKAQKVAAYIKEQTEAHGPFAKIIGYGNAPSDLPFLALCDEAHVIK